MSLQQMQRKELLAAALLSQHVTSFDVRQITLEPGQKSGRHLHPCSVVGYIVNGTAQMQIEGQPIQPLPAGSAVREPAGTIIAHFSNASASEPMTFVAVYLLDGEQELIQTL